MLSIKNNEIYSYSVQFKICPNTSIAEFRSKKNEQIESISTVVSEIYNYLNYRDRLRRKLQHIFTK